MTLLPKRRDTRPLEREIEKKSCDYGKSIGWDCRKYTSPAHRSVPDRMCLHDFGTIIFIEYKRLGGEATDAQKKEHRKLRARGFTVYVIDNVEDAKRVLDQHNPYR